MEKCANCSKTVYPVERVAVLEKIWHKWCLTCIKCNCTLNVKTVRGFDRDPYCSVHYPKLQATVVVDTPSHVSATKVQSEVSQVNYKTRAYDVCVTDTRGSSGKGSTDKLESEKSSRIIKNEEISTPAQVKAKPSKASATSEDGSNTDRLPKRTSSLAGYTNDPSTPKYVAIKDFLPSNPDEVSLKKDDIVFVHTVHDDGWCSIISATSGEKGTVPFNYLEKS